VLGTLSFIVPSLAPCALVRCVRVRRRQRSTPKARHTAGRSCAYFNAYSRGSSLRAVADDVFEPEGLGPTVVHGRTQKGQRLQTCGGRGHCFHSDRPGYPRTTEGVSDSPCRTCLIHPGRSLRRPHSLLVATVFKLLLTQSITTGVAFWSYLFTNGFTDFEAPTWECCSWETRFQSEVRWNGGWQSSFSEEAPSEPGYPRVRRFSSRSYRV
jgi:hypothetical protein